MVKAINCKIVVVQESLIVTIVFVLIWIPPYYHAGIDFNMLKVINYKIAMIQQSVPVTIGTCRFEFHLIIHTKVPMSFCYRW